MLSGSARVLSPAFERVARLTICDGRRAPALRFGAHRVVALAGALCALVHPITGSTNRSLRAQVAILLGVPYSASQISYELRRPRLKGLITRLPRSNTYVLTPDGQRVAIFYTKLHSRLPRPLLAAHDSPAPLALRQATTSDQPPRGLHLRGPYGRVTNSAQMPTPNVQGPLVGIGAEPVTTRTGSVGHAEGGQEPPRVPR
jgi:hypothetical protein